MRVGKRDAVMMKWVMLVGVVVGLIVSMFVSRPLANWMENTYKKLASRLKRQSS